MLTEQQIEDHCLTWFADTGWQVVNGLEIAPDSDQPVLPPKLLSGELSVAELEETL